MGYTLYTKKSFVTNKSNLVTGIKTMTQNLEKIASDSKTFKRYKVLRIGRLLEGTGFYHELDQNYTCVGLEVEIERQFDFDSEPEIIVGFYSLYVGKCHNCAPFCFEESLQEFGVAWKFINGLGDEFTVTKEIASVDQVWEIISDNHLS